MKNISITLLGTIPSKKNSKQIIYVRGRPLIISSKAYKEWHDVASVSLYNDLQGHITLEKVESIILRFYSKDRRAFDLTNKAEGVLDLLVDVGVIKDDNFNVVPTLTLQYGGVDKGYPRCEVTIVKTSK